MTRRQFSLLLGLVGQTGCLVYDEPMRRDLSDAALDSRRDGSISRDAAAETIRMDAVAIDAEASHEAGPDSADAGDGAAIDAVARDADGDESGNDATDVVGDANVDMTPIDVVDARSDGDGASDAEDARDADAAIDVFNDPPIVGCTVDFTVSGVRWGDEGAADEGGSRGVRLVGDIGQIGAWQPAFGISMLEKAPGAWSASLRLPDAVILEFKFVKMDGAREPEWERWLPFDSNRSLRVDCAGDGGTIWVDASTEAGPARRAVGRSYGGAFGVKPLDATK